MPEFSVEKLNKVLKQSKDLQKSIEPFIKEVQNINIQWCFSLITELTKIITKNTQPLIKVNALAVACRLVQLANYPVLLFAEIYLLPALRKTLNFVIENRQFQQIATYFLKEGYSPSIASIQNLSYNFVSMACQFLQLGASIKPQKIYQGKQYNQLSNFKKEYDKMNKAGVNFTTLCIAYRGKDLQNYRSSFEDCLQEWQNYADCLLFFFIQLLQNYLNSEGISEKQNNLLELLKYGQVTITSETIARLIDIVTYNHNFKIRIKALQLLDNFILWGDMEALLVINFTEHIQNIVKIIWSVRGDISLDNGKKIYPDIEFQNKQKLQFYLTFLSCLQTWAECYPSTEHFSLSHQDIYDHSPVYKLYRLLKDKKKFIFPVNSGIPKYQAISHKNMLEKNLRNLMIINDINNQTDSSSVSELKPKTVKQLKEYYQQHRQTLLQLLNNDDGNVNQRMKKLIDYKQHFQSYVQILEIDDQTSDEIDELIEQGFELVDIILAISSNYNQFLQKQHTQNSFIDAITNKCIQFLTPKSERKKLSKVFFSQKLSVRKQELKNYVKSLKSHPLDNQLRQITNNLNIKMYRAKYKQRMERMSNSRSSDQQSLSQNSLMNLQIFTKNKFTRQSRENMNEILNNNSMKNISQKQNQSYIEHHNNVQIKLVNKTEQISNSRQKKKLNVMSKVADVKKGQLFKSTSTKDSKQKIKCQHLTGQFQSQTLSSQQNHPHQNKINIVNEEKGIIVPFHQNQQYFLYLNNQDFKFSYVYSHILIFNSSYLSIQRIINQIKQSGKIKLQIQLILIPRQPLNNFQYQLQSEQCIFIENKTVPFPEKMNAFNRYSIILVGQMKKIPLRLPSIYFFISEYHIFHYILPFCLNFYLQVSPDQVQTLKYYHQVISKPHNCFISQPLLRSQILFPQNQMHNIMIYFPNCLKIERSQDNKNTYLWQVKHKEVKLLLLFEFDLSSKTLIIRSYCLTSQGSQYGSFHRYILNYMSHLLAVKEAC